MPLVYRLRHTPKGPSVVRTTHPVFSKYMSQTGSLFRR